MGMQVNIPRAFIVRAGEFKEPDRDGSRKCWVNLALDDNSELNVTTKLLTLDELEKYRFQPIALRGILKVQAYTSKATGKSGVSMEFTELQITQPKVAAS